MLKPMFMFVVKIVMLCNGQVGGDFVSHLLLIYVPFLHFQFFFFLGPIIQPTTSIVNIVRWLLSFEYPRTGS
jgi:hypothetical protein